MLIFSEVKITKPRSDYPLLYAFLAGGNRKMLHIRPRIYAKYPWTSTQFFDIAITACDDKVVVKIDLPSTQKSKTLSEKFLNEFFRAGFQEDEKDVPVIPKIYAAAAKIKGSVANSISFKVLEKGTYTPSATVFLSSREGSVSSYTKTRVMDDFMAKVPLPIHILSPEITRIINCTDLTFL